MIGANLTERAPGAGGGNWHKSQTKPEEHGACFTALEGHRRAEAEEAEKSTNINELKLPERESGIRPKTLSACRVNRTDVIVQS